MGLTGAELNSPTWIRLWHHGQLLTITPFFLLQMTSWDDAAESKMELMMCQRVTRFSMCPDFPPPNLNLRMCSRSRGRRQWDRRAKTSAPHTSKRSPSDRRQAPALWIRPRVRERTCITAQTINCSYSGSGLFSIRVNQHIIVWQRSQPRVKSRWNPRTEAPLSQ